MDNLAQAKGSPIRQIWGHDRRAHIGRCCRRLGAALSNLRIDRAPLGVARARALLASSYSSATPFRGRKPRETRIGSRTAIYFAKLRREWYFLNKSETELREEALALFNALEKPTSYQTRTKGQLLVDMDRYDEAEPLLLAITDAQQEPWRSYWLSKAQRGLGKLDDALTNIDNALAKIDSKNEYWSTFKAQRFEIQTALGVSAAADELQEAIAACMDERYKDVLQSRLDDYHRKG